MRILGAPLRESEVLLCLGDERTELVAGGEMLPFANQLKVWLSHYPLRKWRVLG